MSILARWWSPVHQNGGVFFSRKPQGLFQALGTLLSVKRQGYTADRKADQASRRKGRHRFSAGTHVHPVDAIAAKYARDRDGFLQRGRKFGADILSVYGDASLRLHPLPRVPVSIVLWLKDEEYPAKLDLLFDSTCEFQISRSDIMWAIAMMCSAVITEVWDFHEASSRSQHQLCPTNQRLPEPPFPCTEKKSFQCFFYIVRSFLLLMLWPSFFSYLNNFHFKIVSKYHRFISLCSGGRICC